MAAVAQLSGLLLSVLCSSVAAAGHSLQLANDARADPGIPSVLPVESLDHDSRSIEPSKQDVDNIKIPAEDVLDNDQEEGKQSFKGTGDSNDNKQNKTISTAIKIYAEPVESSANKSVVDQQSPNKNDKELSNNTSDPCNILGGEAPESYVSEFTTIFFILSEPLEDLEPLYVNLTGIRNLTDRDRIVVGSCLDLSDLYITGEDVKEVIRRMSWYRFSRLDLSSNNITEFPANTFGPVASTARELSLSGNPLRSNSGSSLQRGGLFHLAELKELNMSSCALQDMDLFTPWNSNRLEVVDLSNNNLRIVPSNLQFFHKLKHLYLYGNPITTISEAPFALLWNLQVLSIYSCQVSSIKGDPFRNMDRLKELDLRGNKLTRMSEVRVPHGSMLLSENPWHCDCDVLEYADRYDSAVIDIEEIRCSSPRWLEGLRAAYLTEEVLSMDYVDCALFDGATPALPMEAKHLEVLALVVFAFAAIVMSLQVFWPKKKESLKCVTGADDITYVRMEKTPIN